MKLHRLVLLAALSALALPAFSQSDSNLVNLDTPSIEKHASLSGRFDARIFSGDENLAYGSLSLHYGLGKNLEAILRGSFADRKLLAVAAGGSINHGGSDVELALKLGSPTRQNCAGLIGVSVPSTPSQPRDAFLTLGGMASAQLHERVTAFINPRTILIDGNAILGFGLGGSIKVAQGFSVVGDYTLIVSGNNTRSTATGAPMSRDVFGAAIRYTSKSGAFAVDAGYTNGTGTTTGFGLTSGLGGGGAFYFALAVRR